MSQSLSVVIAARNCVYRIEGTVRPWLFAQEVIVADQMSSDGTGDVAEKMGSIVIRNNPPGDNFDMNRKLGMTHAKSDWILYIDTDERPSAGLIAEIKEFLRSPPLGVTGMRLPNLFYFLGKALRHGIYNARSAEIRMVRNGFWAYPCEEGFHRGVSVTSGAVAEFQNPYRHFNVNTLSEWFIKTNQYTEHDALVAHLRGTSFDSLFVASFRFVRFFCKHYFLKRGFLDGAHGFLATIYFGLYHFTLSAKKWEKAHLSDKHEGEDYLPPIEVGQR